MTINPEWLLSDEEIEDEHENYYLSDYKYGWYKWLVNAQAEHMVKKINKMVNDDLFSKGLGVLSACEVLQEMTGVKPNSIESEE
jgi:hypothetical protein